MPYYMGRWIGAGTKADPFVPESVVGDFDLIDLRPDGGATLDGGGLNALFLWSPTAQSGPGLVFLANGADDILSNPIRNAIKNGLGLATTPPNTLRLAVRELLTNPPVGKWRGVYASLGGITRVCLGPINEVI